MKSPVCLRPRPPLAAIALACVGLAAVAGASGETLRGAPGTWAASAPAGSASAAGASASAPALGGLLVAPTRLVFEGEQRTAQLTLVNTGTAPAIYRISLIDMRMTETGEFREVQVPDSAECFADTLVRFSPRRVELPPQVPQTVRVQVRLPAGLPAGEYRSHLTFRAVPAATPADSADQGPASGVQMKLRAVYGVSIPIIVRKGATWARVSFSEPHVEANPGSDPPVRLAVTLNRTGNRSVYGDFSAVLVRPGQPERVVGQARGFAVYAPNARRRLLLPVRLPPVLEPGARLCARFEPAPGTTDVPRAETIVALR